MGGRCLAALAVPSPLPDYRATIPFGTRLLPGGRMFVAFSPHLFRRLTNGNCAQLFWVRTPLLADRAWTEGLGWVPFYLVSAKWSKASCPTGLPFCDGGLKPMDRSSKNAPRGEAREEQAGVQFSASGGWQFWAVLVLGLTLLAAIIRGTPVFVGLGTPAAGVAQPVQIQLPESRPSANRPSK